MSSIQTARVKRVIKIHSDYRLWQFRIMTARQKRKEKERHKKTTLVQKKIRLGRRDKTRSRRRRKMRGNDNSKNDETETEKWKRSGRRGHCTVRSTYTAGLPAILSYELWRNFGIIQQGCNKCTAVNNTALGHSSTKPLSTVTNLNTNSMSRSYTAAHKRRCTLRLQILFIIKKRVGPRFNSICIAGHVSACGDVVTSAVQSLPYVAWEAM